MSDDLSGDMLAPSWPNLVYLCSSSIIKLLFVIVKELYFLSTLIIKVLIVEGLYVYSPVIIEVPHFASLRGHEREIVILRSEDGEHWKEHPLDATEDAIQEALGGSFEGEGDSKSKEKHVWWGHALDLILPYLFQFKLF